MKEYNGLKAGIWYTVGNMLIKGIPFLSLPIFTRLLTIEDFGVYNIFISYESILNVILCLGFTGTVKTAYFDYREDFDRFITSIITLVAIISMFCLVIGNILFGMIHTWRWMNTYLLNLLILQSMSLAIYDIISTKFVIQGRYKKNLVVSSLITFLNIGISLMLCFVIMNENRANARITGTVLGTATVVIVLIFFQYKKASICLDRSFVNYALKFGVPLIPHILSMTLLAQCDKIMIEAMIGASEAGIYSLAVNITTIITVIMASVDNAWAPWFYGALSKQKYAEIKKTNNVILVLFMYITSGFLLVGPDVIHIMVDKTYWDGTYAFILLTVSIFLNFMYLFDVNLEYFYKKTGYISVATIVCAIVNICLNYILIRRFGYIAAAYATCISKLLLFLMHHKRVRKIDENKVISDVYLISCFAIIIFVSVADYFLIEYIVWRWLLIVAITIITGVYMHKTGFLKKYIKVKEKLLNKM